MPSHVVKVVVMWSKDTDWTSDQLTNKTRSHVRTSDRHTLRHGHKSNALRLSASIGLYRQWLKCNRTQGNAVPQTPDYRKWLKAFPHIIFSVDAGNGRGEAMETAYLTVYSYSARL